MFATAVVVISKKWKQKKKKYKWIYLRYLKSSWIFHFSAYPEVISTFFYTWTWTTVIMLQCIKVFWPRCMYFWYYVQFLLFTHEKFLKPKSQRIFFYQKYVHLGENTLVHNSQRTVAHVHVNVSQWCKQNQTRKYKKMTNKRAASPGFDKVRVTISDTRIIQ